MERSDPINFWYAVNNTEVLVLPRRHLETFGTSVLNYHLVSELMDRVDQVRIREGRLQASPPQIVTPEAYSKVMMEGFGEDAQRYVDWLKEHEDQVHILQYGYRLKQESFSEHVVTDTLANVVERVTREVREREDPMAAVATGVDTPWDVCLVKLFWEVVVQSARTNVMQMKKRGLLDRIGNLTVAAHREIEAAFLAASRDASLINDLAARLQRHGVFEEYQDRFFALVKARK